jgi:hypothetical protein
MLKTSKLPCTSINILFAGDLWQLDPPSGGFLAEIPVQYMQRTKKFDPKSGVARGQAIFLRTGEGSVQGITELTECVRTQDPWLLEVQNQMRAGELSEDNCNFLHGRETTVPGSLVSGACGCGSDACRASWLATRREREQCQRDRKSKHRVMNSSEGSRHLDEHFLLAPAIFLNNDIKDEVNKTRAQIYAIQTEQAITWSVAEDVPTNTVHDAGSTNSRRY